MNDTLLNWLDNETTRIDQYHHHKESMAWLATALYLSGGIVIGLKLMQVSICAKTIATILFVIATIAIFLFIRWQLKNREIARIKSKYLRETMLEIIQRIEDTRNGPKGFDREWLLPQYVYNKIPKSDTNWIHDVGGGTALSQGVSYFAIVLTFTVFCLLVWSGFF